jgi:hypothetical protein
MSLKKLKKLGVGFIEDALKCTHLVVQKIGRTEKFLCAMAVAPFIVTDRWIKDSAKAGYLLGPFIILIGKPSDSTMSQRRRRIWSMIPQEKTSGTSTLPTL